MMLFDYVKEGRAYSMIISGLICYFFDIRLNVRRASS